MANLVWNSDTWAYIGQTSDGQVIRVEGDEMAESAGDVGVDVAELSRKSALGGELSSAEQELLDPDAWAMCLGANQNVSVVE